MTEQEARQLKPGDHLVFDNTSLLGYVNAVTEKGIHIQYSNRTGAFRFFNSNLWNAVHREGKTEKPSFEIDISGEDRQVTREDMIKEEAYGG